MRNDYPKAADLRTFLTAAGITVSDAMAELLDGQVEGARRDFEGPNGCGRIILAGETATLRRFDPPDNDLGTLFLPDFVAVTSVVYQPESGSAETLVLNEDYFLEPSDAADRGLPYTSIDFERLRAGYPAGANRRSVRITARWGYTDTMPADVWTAILARAGRRVFPSTRYEETGGRLGFQHAHISEQYGQAPGKDVTDAWDEQFKATVDAYRKLTF